MRARQHKKPGREPCDRSARQGAPDDLRITAAEEAEAVDTLAETKAGVADGDLDGATAARRAWSKFMAFAQRIGMRLLHHSDTFIGNLADEASKSIGRNATMLIVAGVALIWEGMTVAQLIDKLLSVIK